MEITRNRSDSQPGPGSRFSGSVWLDELAVAPAPARLRAYIVHFAPGARTAWHTHPLGQVIHVTEGVARVQRDGGPIETVRAGDTVRFDPGERHWHGAAPRAFMTHVAMYEADDNGVEVDWAELVTDAEYAG